MEAVKPRAPVASFPRSPRPKPRASAVPVSSLASATVARVAFRVPSSMSSAASPNPATWDAYGSSAPRARSTIAWKVPTAPRMTPANRSSSAVPFRSAAVIALVSTGSLVVPNRFAGIVTGAMGGTPVR